jgi:hypothetical protein
MPTNIRPLHKEEAIRTRHNSDSNMRNIAQRDD